VKQRRSLIIIAIILLMLVPGALLGAQEGADPGEEIEDIEDTPTFSYGLGDQMFSIKAGLFIPLFFFGGGSATSTNLSLGGMGALEWGAFLTGRLALGGELAGSFSFSPLGRTLAIIPITAKLSYFFFKYPFEIPLHIGVGINFTTLGDQLYVGLILKPGASFYWNFISSWAIGLNLAYWFVPQWYTKPELISQNRYGNFLEISISALYHF
jgi:hypothetical protein